MTKTANKNHLFLILALAGFSLVFLYFAITDIVLSLIFTAFFFLTIILYQKPEIGIYLILFSLLGGQLIKISLGSGESSLLLSDLIIPYFVFVWFLRVIIKKDLIISSFIGPFLFLFLTVAFISMVNGLRFLEPKQMLISAFYLFRLLSYGSLFYISASVYSQNSRGLLGFKQVIIAVFFIFSLLGIFQLIYFPSLLPWAGRAGWDPHIGRLFSTFLDPNFAGAFLTFGFIISLSLLTYAKSIEAKIILSLATLSTLTTIILTYSRSSYLFLFISFFVLSILRSKKLLLIGVAAIIILFLIFPKSIERIEGGFSIDESAVARFASWEKTMVIIRDHPLLGVGYNAFEPAQKSYALINTYSKARSDTGSDSSLLTILATTGFTGLLAYFLFYLISIIKAKKTFNFSRSTTKKAFGLALVSILIGLLFHSLFVNSLLYPAIMILLFTLLGLISADAST